MKIISFLIALCFSAVVFGASLSEKRESLIQGEHSVSELQKVLTSEKDPIMRRTAVRLLGECGQDAVSLLSDLVRDDKDPLVRNNALLVLWQICGTDVDAALVMDCLHGDDTNLCMVAATIYFGEKPLSQERMYLAQDMLKTAKDPQLRTLLSQVTWDFHRNVPLLKDRPDWDHDVVVYKEYPLPLEGWAFHLDPNTNLHLVERCYEADYDDSAWKKISIGKTWEECGYKYDGIAWYRITFDVPEKPDVCNAVELHFDSVDESACVWLNGKYVGEHNIGTVGWDVPFSLDVTDLVRWGEPNQITVRVQDLAYAGGIYRPIQLQIMK